MLLYDSRLSLTSNYSLTFKILLPHQQAVAGAMPTPNVVARLTGAQYAR